MTDISPRMKWADPDQSNAIHIFKQQCQLFFSVKNVKKEKQVDHILLFAGEEGIKLFNSWDLSDQDKKDPDKVWDTFIQHIEPLSNWRVARMYLQKIIQERDESIDAFVTKLKLHSKKCNFRTTDNFNERVLEQLTAGTRHDALQKELLSKPDDFTLANAINLARTHEASIEHMQQFAAAQGRSTSADVHAIKRGSSSSTSCGRCTIQHPPGRDNCPAINSKCDKCGKLGHWAPKCRSDPHGEQRVSHDQRREQRGPHDQRRRQRSPSQREQRTSARGRHRRGRSPTPPPREVDYIQSEEELAQFDELTFHNIKVSIDTITSPAKEFYTTLHIKRPRSVSNLVLKLDTGSEGNVMPLRTFRRMWPAKLGTEGFPRREYVTNVPTRLKAYNGTEITNYGAIDVDISEPNKQKQWSRSRFFIVESDGPVILGLPTMQKMNLVTFHCAASTKCHQSIDNIQTQEINSVTDLTKQYPDSFDKIGNFPGEYHIVLKENMHPVIHAPRKCSIHLKDELKQELQNMEDQGVIRKVSEPTDWVSSIALSRRANGKIRVCLDPKDLNKAIKRCHHRTPTIEEITHQFTGSKFFSKLDAKNGYWSVKLDDESSLLTTFNSPFGRYCYKRMPFGLVMSQDVFQQRMDQILENCPGTLGIADDIAVYGKTKDEHDKHLRNVMKVAAKFGLMFNSEKCHINVNQIKFFGMLYDREGVHPDPQKVSDIKKIAPPTDKTSLQEFLGMVTYMSPFIRNLSDNTANLRELLKKDSEFVWTPSHQQTFESVKNLICDETTLTYFNQNEPTVIQVDASTRGLGATLMQQGKPIAFASKSLSPTEQRYANIERELLAIVFGCERFHTFVYGKPFTVESDHKPLEMIQQKPLTSAPPRLQRMLLRLQQYDVTVKYRPGKEVLIADGLSRLRKDANSDQHIDLDVQIHNVAFSKEKIAEIREETAKDDTLSRLMKIIIAGWPDKFKDLHPVIRPYWSFRDELCVEDGVIMKGVRLIIPPTMQNYILQKLHEGHQGIEKSKLRAKDCVYWFNINAAIEEMVKKCHTCQEFQKAQPKETLLPHEIPTRPWQMLGTDLFNFNDDEYLIIADYSTKFPFIRKMPRHCTSSAVVAAMKQVFSEQGIPEKVISDNGPQYDSAHFKTFACDWGFEHVTSSPHFPQSNGFVERTIQTVKNILKKARASGQDPDMALLCARTTPVDNVIPSPAETLYGRKIRGNLPVKIPNASNQKDEIYDRLKQRQETQKRNFDKHAKDLPELKPGQPVRIQDHVTGKWQAATITDKRPEPRSYMVKTKSGSILRRNRKHISSVPQDNAQTNASEQNPAAVSDTNCAHHAAECDQNNAPKKRVRFNIPLTMQTSTYGRAIQKPKKLDL